MRLVVGTRDTLPTADEDRRWVLDGLRDVADALFDLAEPCHPVPHLVLRQADYGPAGSSKRARQVESAGIHPSAVKPTFSLSKAALSLIRVVDSFQYFSASCRLPCTEAVYHLFLLLSSDLREAAISSASCSRYFIIPGVGPAGTL